MFKKKCGFCKTKKESLIVISVRCMYVYIEREVWYNMIQNKDLYWLFFDPLFAPDVHRITTNRHPQICSLPRTMYIIIRIIMIFYFPNINKKLIYFICFNFNVLPHIASEKKINSYKETARTCQISELLPHYYILG